MSSRQNCSRWKSAKKNVHRKKSSAQEKNQTSNDGNVEEEREVNRKGKKRLYLNQEARR